MTDEFHPVKLEIYRSLFASVAEEMGTVLRRTAYSPNIKERRDYSCAVFDGQGRLVAMGDHMPVHLGSMPRSVTVAIEKVSLGPGDIAILNDPFAGGTHLPDITLIAPVYEVSDRYSQPAFYVASRAHHSDVGGMSAGSMPLSSEIFQEGFRIPPLKLYHRGRLNRDLLQLLLSNVRTPVEREGDLAAQVGSLKVGEKRLIALVGRNGRSEVQLYMEALQGYAEKMMRQLIAGLADGRYSADDFLDEDGIEARPIRIKVSLEVAGEKLSIDFSGSDPQVRGNLNAVYAITLSAVFYVLRCIAPEEMPASSGLLGPIEVIAPAGTIVNANYPAATAAGNVETSQRIVDVLLRAFSKVLPDRIPAASSGTMNNLSLGGTHPATGQPFSYYETIGGGMGASPEGAGDSGVHTHMTNSLNTPIEAFEPYFPVRVREYRLCVRSGGKGRFQGGDGIVRSLEALAPCQVTILSERRKTAPYGLNGGRSGRKGRNYLMVKGHRRMLPGKASVTLSKGDSIWIETPGGGGWGD